jgi:hypothetical protein
MPKKGSEPEKWRAKKPAKPEGVRAAPRYKTRATVSKHTTTKTLKTLIDESPSKDELDALNAELARGSDRACAIIAAATVESFLTTAILVKLENIDDETVENLKSQNGALGGFFSKIYLGYALGLYDKATRYDLETIRRIRNAFAHAKRPISFLNGEVSAACDDLNPKSVNIDFLTPEKFRQIGYPHMSAERLKYLAVTIGIVIGIHTKSQATLALRIKMAEKDKGHA